MIQIIKEQKNGIIKGLIIGALLSIMVLSFYSGQIKACDNSNLTAIKDGFLNVACIEILYETEEINYYPVVDEEIDYYSNSSGV